MKLKCALRSVIAFSIIGLILQVAGLALTDWFYAPSVVENVDGNNVTFYQLRGLWQNKEEIAKIKISSKDEIEDADETHKNRTFTPLEFGPWFTAVRSIELAGGSLNLGAIISACIWYHYSSKMISCSYTFVALILAGILELLGVAILVGKTEPDLTSWCGALCGGAGAFCIMAASFIRAWQQDEYA